MALVFRILVFTIFSTITFIYNINAQNVISGKVLDDNINKPVEFAQLALMNPSDSSIVTGTLSDYNGNFHLETSVSGEYLIRVSFVGYNDQWNMIDIKSGKNRFGTISMQASVTQLEEVEITAAAMLFRSEADRRIFNVENMPVAEGGTAMQLLETLPSVQVDEEGNISLRGSGNILIYINGRPTNLTADETESILEQFPASTIKSVELITNPSARYDAEGVGGIINIILKEQRLIGFNGQVNTSVGTGNKYSGGVLLNLRQNKFNLSANYSYQYREMWEVNESFRENFHEGTSPIIDQDYYTENWTQGHVLRLAGDYEINSASGINVYSSMNYNSRDRERVYNIRNMANISELDSMYVRLLEEDQSRATYEVGAGYIYDNSNGKRLTSNITYSLSSQDRIEYFNQQFFDQNMVEIDSKFQDQFYERPLNNNMFLVEIDYMHNIGDRHRLETGLKSTLRHDNRSQNFGLLNLETEEYEDVVLSGMPISNRFTRDENIYAGYLIFRNMEQRFSYMAGLRAEYTNTEIWQDYGLKSGFLDADGFVPARDTVTTSNYLSLFPSLYLNYELTENQDIQASYSRRIRRPRIGSTMPFLNAQDFYNLRLGNPYLEPAFTDNYEINYIRAWESYMVTAGVFHRQTKNSLTRLFVPFAQGALVTWTNANTRDATGVEFINYLQINSNFDATLTANYYHSIISGELEGISFSNESYSWTLSLLGNMNIPNWFRLQMSANYWGPRVVPQGQINSVFTMNLGLRRNVLNNQGTLSFNVTDLFNTRKFSMETTSGAFYQQRDFYRESRVFTLSFTWRFRNFRENSNGRSSQDNIDGDIDGLF
jgi:iron complex outermembrane recepter protein